MSRNNRTIAVKLSLVSGAALIVTVVAIAMLAILSVRRQAIDNFQAVGMGQIRQIDDGLGHTFDDIRDDLKFLSSMPVMQSADASVTNYLTHGGDMTPDQNGGVESEIFALLKRFGDNHPTLRYAYIGTKWGGYIQWPKDSVGNSPYDPRERPWYKKGIQNPDEVQRTGAYAAVGAEPGSIISYVRAIQDTHGDQVGVMGMDISLDGLAKMVANVRFGQTGYLMIVEDTGAILVDPRDASHLLKPLAQLGGGYAQLAGYASGMHTVNIGETGYNSIVYTSPRSGWKYVGLIPHAEMMAGVKRLAVEIGLISALLLFAALALNTMLGRRMTAPLRQVSLGMSDIASGEGDLTRRLPVVSRDEVGILAAQFNAFVEKLNGVLWEIRENSDNVRTAAHEISAANLDLSARTEEQAASLEETAASMTQLTEAVKQNASNAQQANVLATRAAGSAEEGNQAMQDMIRTIDQIGISSRKVSEITGVIEDIAFQTNILALNAAVEAARAGDQGRGFAVVASAVRSLAQRSAASAKEIRDLIASSVAIVKQGGQQASEVGSTIAQVKMAIEQVSTIVGEIALASDEQSRGIEQINQAVNHMDRTTQQNAAMVEEAAAVAHSLDDQASKLKHTVSAFTLSDRRSVSFIPRLESGQSASVPMDLPLDEAMLRGSP